MRESYQVFTPQSPRTPAAHKVQRPPISRPTSMHQRRQAKHTNKHVITHGRTHVYPPLEKAIQNQLLAPVLNAPASSVNGRARCTRLRVLVTMLLSKARVISAGLLAAAPIHTVSLCSAWCSRM